MVVCFIGNSYEQGHDDEDEIEGFISDTIVMEDYIDDEDDDQYQFENSSNNDDFEDNNEEDPVEGDDEQFEDEDIFDEDDLDVGVLEDQYGYTEEEDYEEEIDYVTFPLDDEEVTSSENDKQSNESDTNY